MSLKRILANAEIGFPTKHWREPQERSFITPVNLGVDGQKSVSVTVAMRQLNRDKVKKPYTGTIDRRLSRFYREAWDLVHWTFLRSPHKLLSGEVTNLEHLLERCPKAMSLSNRSNSYAKST